MKTNNLNSKRVLIVDDTKDVLTTLNYIFGTDYELLSCISARHALELLETEDVDIIISDIKMPEMDGYEFYDNVQELKPSIPFVFFTAYVPCDVSDAKPLTSCPNVFYKPDIDGLEDFINLSLQDAS